MIKAKHPLYPLFKWLMRLLLKRHFHDVSLEGEFVDRGTAVLVIANHVSWWDGFWVEYLNQQRLHRRLHFMMLEEQLRKHWYFQYTGGFSVRKHSREVLQSMDYTLALLQRNDHVVLLFPQGEIQSAYLERFRFQKGIQYILNRCPADTQVLFVANLTDYFSDIKPTLFVYFQSYSVADLKKLGPEAAYNLFYTNSVNRQKNKSS
ncbi:MAG: lysophospholipid acyltransferase family protein [Microbacter sp.]